MSIPSLSFIGGEGNHLFAQELPESASQFLQAAPHSAVPLHFATGADISLASLPEHPIEWGMDVAWNSESNVRVGTNFITPAVLCVGRVSFQPSDLVDENGNLSTAQKAALQSRLNNIALSGARYVILNCDHEALNKNNYYGKPTEWYRVIKASVQYIRSKGFSVVTISPFNEPDYSGWGEGTKAHFKEIARLITEDDDLAGIRVSAGNTLNCDQADSWYQYMKPYVGEGCTHQLAGEFATYAKFWQTVRGDGNHATADELHNVMEAIVGIHYGMQTGVWWGSADATRGEFCKASYYGKEIGYAENRAAWSGAAVYKWPDGRTEAFLGVSERQAKTSTYNLVATDRPAYFDGYGPLQSYAMEMPGGTGYATEDQRNAERKVQIHYGEDVPVEPIVAGDYVIMNRQSGFAIGCYNGQSADGTMIVQTKYTGTNPNTFQQWTVVPNSPTIGGDFTSFVLRSVRNSSQVIDLKNWSLEPGGTLIAYTGGLGTNEQWFTEYAGDGDWYIRSRHSGLYLEAATKYANAKIQQAEFSGADNQRWRFMPVNAALDLTAPSVPTGLEATPQSASVLLTWNANTESDVAGYQIQRGVRVSDDSIRWDVIGRMVSGTSFLDNGGVPSESHYYRIQAIDRSRNRSEASAATDVQVPALTAKALVAHYPFDQSAADQSENRLDASASGAANYNASVQKEGSHSLSFNGSDTYVQLPPFMTAHPQLTVAFWVRPMTTSPAWSRLFDFGNGTDQYMFLTPNNGSEMRFVMKNGGAEEILSAPRLPVGWHHVAVTIADAEADKVQVTLYIDGEAKATSQDFTIHPSDIQSVLNYVGRSQYQSDPLFQGYMDDLRLYNFPLTAEELTAVMNGEEINGIETLAAAPDIVPSGIYNLKGQRLATPFGELPAGLYIVGGRKVLKQ